MKNFTDFTKKNTSKAILCKIYSTYTLCLPYNDYNCSINYTKREKKTSKGKRLWNIFHGFSSKE